MLLNYIKIAIRNIAKYKVFSFINIAGMAISLASFILIALFISDELQYDTHHPDGDRTYRVYNVTDIGGTVSYLPIVPYPFASYMKKDFPEIESTLQMMDTYGEKLFIKDDKEVLEPSGVFAESAIFDMLSLNVIAGKAADALNKPNTIALSQSLAIKYFGAQNPVGEMLKVNHIDWQVTAVYADPPRHFHLKIKLRVVIRNNRMGNITGEQLATTTDLYILEIEAWHRCKCAGNEVQTFR
jgi:putative ABC transport system permease protein